MRPRRTAPHIRERLIEHIAEYGPIRERYARVFGQKSAPDPRIEALERGERVELPAWEIASALPELQITLHPDAPQFYVVHPDGSLTPQEPADDPYG